MAKKKASAVAYVPLNTSAIPLVEQKISQIPPYEDSGIKYQGKFKTQQSKDTYELRGQRTRFYTVGVQNLGAGATDVTPRPRNEIPFYATKVLIQWHQLLIHDVGEYVRLSDRTGTNNELRIAFFPTEDDGSIFLDFTDSPRLFEGTDFAITTVSALGATGFIVFSLFGWEEQP